MVDNPCVYPEFSLSIYVNFTEKPLTRRDFKIVIFNLQVLALCISLILIVQERLFHKMITGPVVIVVGFFLYLLL